MSVDRGPDVPGDPTPPPRRRRGPRRATSGPTGGVAPTPPAVPGPVGDGRSADDTDTGWGERTPDDDERFLRDVPPHW